MGPISRVNDDTVYREIRPFIFLVCRSSNGLTISLIGFDLCPTKFQYCDCTVTNRGFRELRFEDEGIAVSFIVTGINLGGLCKMTTTIVGIIITACAIKMDRITLYRHHVLPIIALAGVLTVVVSLTL